jgi:hypothetical protein
MSRKGEAVGNKIGQRILLNIALLLAAIIMFGCKVGDVGENLIKPASRGNIETVQALWLEGLR